MYYHLFHHDEPHSACDRPNRSQYVCKRTDSPFSLEGKFSIRLSVELASSTDLTDVLRQLGEQNFYQALDVSKTFRADAPRALATIAVARAVLVEQP